MNLEQEVRNIQERNMRVEADKAWETSFARRVAVALLTYLVVGIFFAITGFPRPFLSALVPTTGYLLSTLSLSIFKTLWVRQWLRRRNTP